jgi:hypothetical protein
MEYTQKRGGFLILNGHVKQQIKKEKQDKQKEKSSLKSIIMSELFVFYKDVEYIRTSLKNANRVEFIVSKNSEVKEKEVPESLSRGGSLINILNILPDYFVQINQSEAINIYHVKGRSKHFIFMRNTMLKITRTFKKEAELKLKTFIDSSEPIV